MGGVGKTGEGRVEYADFACQESEQVSIKMAR